MQAGAMLIVSVAILLSVGGCSVAPQQMGQDISDRVSASTPQEEGEIVFRTYGEWIVGSKEYSFSADKQSPAVPGVIVVTRKSLLFERWGGTQTPLTIARKIALTDIQEAKLITFGLGTRLVIRSRETQFDAFSATDGGGNFIDRTRTSELVDLILSLVKQK